MRGATRGRAGASGARRRISVRLALTSSSVGPGCACCGVPSRARCARGRATARCRVRRPRTVCWRWPGAPRLRRCALARERREQQFVRAAVEGRELEPLVDIGRAASCGSARARFSSSTVWMPRKRRRSAVIQASNIGLRAISRPSSNSPANRRREFRCRSTPNFWMPCSGARVTSSVSTDAVGEVEADRVPSAMTRLRPCSSTSPRILDRHQRNSPRGSLGTSHSSSQICERATGRLASTR